MAVTPETFTYKGQTWKRFHAPKPDEAYVLGVDLGQSQDPSAVVVLHHTRTPLPTWSVIERTHTTRQDVQERFDVVYAERLRLNSSYPDIVNYVSEVLQRSPLSDDCHLVIDETGVGRPVGDMFDGVGLRPIRVSITAGTDATKIEGHPRRWSVAKSLLISGVDAALHAAQLRFAADLRKAHALAEELKDFRRHLSAAGRATYQARTGKNDDLVLAVAIAVWWARQRGNRGITIGAHKV
jgi:hypothetical protein